MRKNIICVDPGVGGGVGWINRKGDIFCAPNPYPSDVKGRPAKDLVSYQIKGISKLMHKVAGTMDADKLVCYVENVAYRPSDTPMTSGKLNFNFGVWTAICSSIGDLKLINPVSWQNQLGIAIPHGTHNYKARKKCFQDFAQYQWPAVTQISWQGNSQFKSCIKKVTQKTADAMCMLWVYSEKDL